jgi:rare lipoprotein A
MTVRGFVRPSAHHLERRGSGPLCGSRTVFALALLAAGCSAATQRASGPPPSSAPGVAKPAPETPSRTAPAALEVRTGRASWYGRAHEGKPTASGEPFDADAMTAAHRTLPFGTWLLVENVANGRTVRVRVNDRGPVIDGRVLDLSRAAARALGMTGQGVIEVRYRVVDGAK